MSSERDLHRVRAVHPDWTIRCEARPEWAAYVAQRAQVITTLMLNELETRLAREIPAGADPRIIAARELLGAHHQPLVMAPGDLRPLLSRHQRGLAGLLDVLGQKAGW